MTLIFVMHLKIAHLTPKELEMHGCIFSHVAADILVLKHQTISTHITDKVIIALDQFQTKRLHL